MIHFSAILCLAAAKPQIITEKYGNCPRRRFLLMRDERMPGLSQESRIRKI